jgi:glycosyltransferase involved in cell wall biosynthesis
MMPAGRSLARSNEEACHVVPALIDAHHLGQGQTGNETWARNVVSELARRPSEVHLAVTAAGKATVCESWTPNRVHEVSRSSSRRLAYDLPMLARRLRPDAMLVQYTLPMLGARHLPGVVVVHDLSFERPEAAEWIPAPTLARYRATIRSSVRRARMVLVPSEWTKQDVVRTYGLDAERVLVATNAVDEGLAEALAKAPIDRRDSCLSVLTVGTVLPRKNLVVVARAVRLLQERGLPACLRMVGPIPAAGHSSARQIQGILGDSLEILGPVSTAKLASAYRSAHVLAFPSRFEGFGIPLIEAMAAELPVVSSTATCLPEIGGNAVRYADPDDVEAWAEALADVLTDADERRRLATAGVERAATFRWSAAVDAVSQALEAAAA